MHAPKFVHRAYMSVQINLCNTGETAKKGAKIQRNRKDKRDAPISPYTGISRPWAQKARVAVRIFRGWMSVRLLNGVQPSVNRDRISDPFHRVRSWASWVFLLLVGRDLRFPSQPVMRMPIRSCMWFSCTPKREGVNPSPTKEGG